MTENTNEKKRTKKELDENSVYLGVKFRLYPTEEQAQTIKQTLGCSRFVYNHFLDQAQIDYKADKKKKSAYDYMKQLPELKKEYPWLKDADSVALQQSIQDMDNAFKNFFRKTHDFPKFKKKKNYGSYRTLSKIIAVHDHIIRLPKLGEVEIGHHYDISKIKRVVNATVSLAPSGKFFVSVCCEMDRPTYQKGNGTVYIHLDTKEYMVYINGSSYPMPQELRESMPHLIKLQQNLSWKQQGSSNWDKARRRLAKYHETIANRRHDYLHKLSTDLVREYETIVLEPEPIQEIMETCSSDDAIKLTDISYYEFCRQIHYKAGLAGKQVIDYTLSEDEEESPEEAE